MDIAEAFEILNLSKNSSKEEIKEAHRKLIKKVHPRIIDENHDEAAVINNARDILIKYFEEMENNVSLVKQVVEIMNIDRTQATKQNEYKLQADAILNKVSRKYNSQYKNIQLKAKFTAAITATLTLFSSNILPIAKNSSPKDAEMATVLGFITFLVAAYYVYINSQAEKIKDSIDDLKEFLNDKTNYYEIFNNLLLYRKDKFAKISRNEFESLIYNCLNNEPIHESKLTIDDAFGEIFASLELGNFSLKDLARKIGYNDFSRLIISKGLENSILIEEEVSIDGLIKIEYKINQGNK
ncbi:J domain-containing protein [Flavobacterium plurextorum]|uniref:J domain-containing protein n=1 Tax=Flavobacterium plurextorum TaxID=1114867 RepID=UPI00375769E2